MSYVILSRITSINQLFLKEFDQKKIYCSAVAKREAQKLRARAINIQCTEWDQERDNCIKISSINARSLQQHFRDMQKDEFMMKSDILCVQETWLESDPKESITQFHEHYVHGRSKGIAIFTKQQPICTESFQTVTCSIIKATFIQFDIINMYRFSSGNDVLQFTAEVIPLLDESRTQIIVGDVNIDLFKNPENLFTESMKQRGFQQLVRRPTHVLGGLIDHVYFYSPHMEASCTLYKHHTVFWSDHTCQSFVLKTKNDCQ
jgi:exonuclease III